MVCVAHAELTSSANAELPCTNRDIQKAGSVTSGFFLAPVVETRYAHAPPLLQGLLVFPLFGPFRPMPL